MNNRNTSGQNGSNHQNYNREAVGHRETAREADRTLRNHKNGQKPAQWDETRERFEGAGADVPHSGNADRILVRRNLDEALSPDWDETRERREIRPAQKPAHKGSLRP